MKKLFILILTGFFLQTGLVIGQIKNSVSPNGTFSSENKMGGKSLKPVNKQTHFRSHVSTIVGVHPLPSVCSANDTSYATIGFNPLSTVVLGDNNSLNATGHNDSLTFIPDGPNCPPGIYNSGILFNQFAPGDTVASASDILSVVVKLEHSYSGDLGFRLICPNGQHALLSENDHNGFMWLGIPDEMDGNPYCSPSVNPPGIGWVYGWSQTYSQQGRLNVLDNIGSGTAIPPIDSINHTNYFTPDSSLSSLIGCPLNGIWQIEIIDNWASDNGYVFSWGINFDPAIVPVNVVHTIPIDSIIWSGPFFNVINDSMIRIIPGSAGTFQYGVSVIDSAGNIFDTTFNLTVIQTPEVNLGSDTTLCDDNFSFVLDAGPAMFYEWSTGNSSQFQPVISGGYYVVTATNVDLASSLECFKTDTIHISVVTCAGIEANEAKDELLRIYPNPAAEYVTIELKSKDITDDMISVYDLQGKLILQQPVLQSITDVNVSALAKGLYFIKLSTPEVNVIKKLIKE